MLIIVVVCQLFMLDGTVRLAIRVGNLGRFYRSHLLSLCRVVSVLEGLLNGELATSKRFMDPTMQAYPLMISIVGTGVYRIHLVPMLESIWRPDESTSSGKTRPTS